MQNVIFHSGIEQSDQFFVRATESMPNYEIFTGDFLTIDPSKSPKEGDVVLVDDEVSAWRKQPRIDGVVVYVGRSR